MQKLKSTDLRIGNYVMQNGVICSVYGIQSPTPNQDKRFNNKVVVTLWNGGLFDVTIEDCDPIELTEEWLLKAGAVKLDFKVFPSFNLLGLQINFINGMWIEYVSRIEITGIHHLQNIFFFRNSEELTFKD